MLSKTQTSRSTKYYFTPTHPITTFIYPQIPSHHPLIPTPPHQTKRKWVYKESNKPLAPCTCTNAPTTAKHAHNAALNLPKKQNQNPPCRRWRKCIDSQRSGPGAEGESWSRKVREMRFWTESQLEEECECAEASNAG